MLIFNVIISLFGFMSHETFKVFSLFGEMSDSDVSDV